MATVNFSIPDAVKQAFNETFAGQSAIVADHLHEAVERAQPSGDRTHPEAAPFDASARRTDAQSRAWEGPSLKVVVDASVTVKPLLGCGAHFLTHRPEQSRLVETFNKRESPWRRSTSAFPKT